MARLIQPDRARRVVSEGRTPNPLTVLLSEAAGMEEAPPRGDVRHRAVGARGGFEMDPIQLDTATEAQRRRRPGPLLLLGQDCLLPLIARMPTGAVYETMHISTMYNVLWRPSAAPGSVSDGVFGGSGAVLPSGGCGPDAVAGLGLFDGPAGVLFLMVVVAAMRPAVAGTGPAAPVPGDAVFEVAALGVAAAGGPVAVAVADVDQVAEGVAGLVAG